MSPNFASVRVTDRRSELHLSKLDSQGLGVSGGDFAESFSIERGLTVQFVHHQVGEWITKGGDSLSLSALLNLFPSLSTNASIAGAKVAICVTPLCWSRP